MLSNIEIQNIIPHRYPFLLIDKIEEVEPGKRAVAIKNVSINEPFFQGHFPKNPIMPGVLIVEALAQTACVAGLMLEENKGKLGVFTGIESMKFRKQVVPGDVLRLEAEFLVFKMGMGKVKVSATVDGQIAAQGEIKFAMIDQDKK
ncbi:MAG: 3-hydroxyacyl-ACP dehydratase FabZ [Clostridium sp.]|jgi:3-hydroxyacyl-[acyl-carrier-protein] dehydratase|nr:3-hydroxyacyl-ACP dehydratase FabZ [Clostridium sp.]